MQRQNKKCLTTTYQRDVEEAEEKTKPKKEMKRTGRQTTRNLFRVHRACLLMDGIGRSLTPPAPLSVCMCVRVTFPLFERCLSVSRPSRYCCVYSLEMKGREYSTRNTRAHQKAFEDIKP